MSKNSKKISNNNLNNLITPISHRFNNINGSPYNFSNKNSLKNNLENIIKKNKKDFSSKKNKEKSRKNEEIINNYFSQRSRVNTEGNENNIKKIKFSSNFLRNKIELIFNSKNSRSNSKKVNIKNKNFENNNNFRKANKVNNIKNSDYINQKKSSNNCFTKLNTNSKRKIIDENSYNNEYNITNIHNRSNTQSNLKKTNKKINNSTHKLKSYSSKYRNSNKYEDMEKININKRNINLHKNINTPGAIRKISPFRYYSNKISNTQNYLKSISKKSKNKSKQYDKEKKILITEPKEIKKQKNLNTNEFILKENSSYLVISKKPTQITNFIEKKENNKYINNYFNICENKKTEMENENKKEYISHEEIHFFFVKQIQMGNKLNSYINTNKS